MTANITPEPFVCTLPLAPRHHIAAGFRPLPLRCCFCPRPVESGDIIACAEHRRQIDAMLMPWDRQP